jgi:uncharacterized membrane-anchored protein YhcB (DUF1043 family)
MDNMKWIRENALYVIMIGLVAGIVIGFSIPI